MSNFMENFLTNLFTAPIHMAEVVSNAALEVYAFFKSVPYFAPEGDKEYREHLKKVKERETL